MKKLFYFSLLGLLAFEVMNVYFIMPLPGSQRMNSIALAYFLYRSRWVFRGLLLGLLVYSYLKAGWKRRWTLFIPVVIVALVAYFANFKMSADHMFYQPQNKVLAAAGNNHVDSDRLVIGVVINSEARAYPIQFIGYHHLVVDTLGGRPILISYCTVCRTGRVYDPVIDGQQQKFRLVGMDHFNAMFEDAATGSWWRQATGEAVAGKLKGKKLAEIACSQVSLGEWLRLHPASLVMQEDNAFSAFYARSFDYESGKSRSMLTGTDTGSWKDKSWVIGVEHNGRSKAYDWNKLKRQRMIADKQATGTTLLVITPDNRSFFAFALDTGANVTAANDLLIVNGHSYQVNGQGVDTTCSLTRLPAYQEFWHSWRTFHPATEKYN